MTSVDLAAAPERGHDAPAESRSGVARNVVDLTINRFCPPVFALLILVTIGRISSSLLGWYSVVGAYFFALQTLPFLGLTPWIMREAARRPADIGVVFGSSVAFAVTAAAVLSGLLPFVLGAAQYPPDVDAAVWIAALTTGPYIVTYVCELMFVTTHRTTLISVLSVLENVLKLVLSLVALARGHGLVALFWIAFATRAAAAIAYWVGLKRVVLSRQRVAVDSRLLREMLRASPVFLLNAVVVLAIQRSALLALSWQTAPERIAEFAIAYRPIEVGIIVITAFIGALYPRLSRADGHGETRESFQSLSSTITRLVLVTTVVMGAALLIGADTIVSVLFPRQFPEAATLLRVLVLTLPTAGIRLCTSSMLLARGRPGADLGALGAGAAVLVGLLLLWVPAYGAWGAVWALVIEGVVQAVLRLVLVRRWYGPGAFVASTGCALASAAALGASMAIGVVVTAPAGEAMTSIAVVAVYVAVLMKLRGLAARDLSFLGLRRADTLPRPGPVET
jgi:O-antigen/teichoic acid export membrane protein